MKYVYGFLGALFFLFPLSASAATATQFEVSGWIPYWRSATGTADVLPHLNELTEVNPFVFTLRSGSILDKGSLGEEPWASFIAAAKAQHVRVVPTIMTGNGALLHTLLSSTRKRVALENAVAKLLKSNGFDGIDIDFEGKRAADRNHFSTFLKGLSQRIGKKWVMCSIEARTPIADRYAGTAIPPDAAIYSNDFTQINKYCDRVRIMAYDQQNVDLSLANAAASSSELYAPVADPAWVEKVVDVAARDIARSKIEIGIPTYGYEYAVTAYANSEYVYDILWTFNPAYATSTAAQYGIVPQRARWGEMAFTYLPAANAASSASSPQATTSPQSLGPLSALATVAAASTFATANNSHTDFRYVVWPDAQSIAEKIALAKRLGVRGVSIFKFDGGEDPNIWSVLQGVKQ